jgi:hypothetical protein
MVPGDVGIGGSWMGEGDGDCWEDMSINSADFEF